MTVIFLKLEIEATDKDKLKTIKTWLQSQIISTDLSDKVSSGNIKVAQNSSNSNLYSLSAQIYLKSIISKTKYKNIIINQFNKINKTGLLKAKIIQCDNCTHDESRPKPCKVIKQMEWVA